VNEYTKWSMGFVAFFSVLLLGCYLWYQWDIAPYREEAERTQQLIAQSQVSRQTAETTQQNDMVDDFVEQVRVSSVESTDNPGSPIKQSDVGEPKQRMQHTQMDTETTVRMSPHGLGPYPELPAGWSEDAFSEDDSIEHELIERVRIKMYNEGIYTSGASMDADTGLVYPITTNSIYVEWSTTTVHDLGEVRYMSELMGHPDITSQIRSSAESREYPIPQSMPLMTEEDIPAGIEVLNKSDGIAPYDYLDLDRQ